MNIEINLNDPEAVYEQIVRQVQHAVRCGALAPGAALPSIRQLADDLDLNHNTVAKAYKMLESSRVILTAGRKGTFVHPDAVLHVANSAIEQGSYRMASLVRELHGSGLSAEQIRQLVEHALAALP